MQFNWLGGAVKHHNTDLPLIALAESFCLAVPSQKIQVRDLLNKIVSENGTEGKEKGSERNITRPLPMFTFAILSNLSKLLS